MPVTKIKISFDRVFVKDTCDLWGDGDWRLRATIDGVAVGHPDPKHEFTARDQQWIVLPEAQWSRVVDVSAKGPGTKVQATFGGVDVDLISDDDLGTVTAEFKFPYRKEVTFTLNSPKMPGGLFFPDYQAYTLQMSMKVVEEVATTTLTGPTSISVSRQNNGSETLSTIGVTPVTPRV